MCALIIGLFITNLYGIEWKWKTITSKLNISQTIEADSILWCATEGGLLALNPNKNQFSTWTNTENLIENHLNTLSVDQSQSVWIGTKNGYIQNFNPIQSTWLTIDDYYGHEISKILIQQDTMWVGLDIGVSLYLIDKTEVKETYRQLGNKLPVETNVIDIVIHQNQIWIATPKGLAFASLNFQNLMDPANWNNLLPGKELPNGEVQAIISSENDLYIATTDAVAEYDGFQWHTIGNFEATQLTLYDGKLYACTGSELYFYRDSVWIQPDHPQFSVNHLFNGINALWVSTDEGLYKYFVNENRWEHFKPNSMGCNRVTDVAIDQLGNLVVCFLTDGFSYYNKEKWQNYSMENLQGLRGNDFRSAIIDQNNNKWLACWGGGLVYFGADSTFRFYHNQNQYINGIKSNPNYPVVSDLCIDDSGILWILNKESITDQPLISVTPDSIWTYYGLQDGLSTNYLSVIIIDEYGRKFIGTDELGKKGVIIFDDNGTPADKNDDPAITYIRASDGLKSEEITDLALDQNGGVWIGTKKGLYNYFGDQLDNQYYLPSDNIQAVAVDGANNVWVGTDIGLSFFSEQDFQWTHFSIQNSDLVSNDIRSIVVADQTGQVYICTNNGISVIDTPYSKPLSSFTDLLIYPVPYYPADNSYLIIDNLTWNVAVHIFTLNGFLVREFSQTQIFGKQIIWDGLNTQGQPVPSGIYFVVAQNENGKSRVGKFALIR